MKLKPPDIQIIEKKIILLLKGANKIPLSSFLRFLEIEESLFYEKNHIWSQKFKYYLEDNKIIKNE
jgi:hypothetical protein